MHIVLGVRCWNGFKAIYLTEHSMWYLVVKNLTPIVLNVVYPKDSFSVHFFLFYLLMIYVMYFHCFSRFCKNLNTLIALMNTELISLNNWFKANKRSFNTKISRIKSNSIGSIRFLRE